MKAFVVAFALVLVMAANGAWGQTLKYGSCDVYQNYFFASPFTVNVTTVDILNKILALQSDGVQVDLAVSNAPQLIVVINATADHVLNVEFSPLDATLNNIGVTISSVEDSGASTSGPNPIAMTLAAAGLVVVGSAGVSGKPTVGGVTSTSLAGLAAATAAGYGMGLLGSVPVAAASSVRCKVSFVRVTVYVPATVRSYTINNGQQQCNVPYFLNPMTSQCSICNSQFTIPPYGVPYPCIAGVTGCCENEFCVNYELGGSPLTRCCAVASQINSTECCPLNAPIFDSDSGMCVSPPAASPSATPSNMPVPSSTSSPSPSPSLSSSPSPSPSLSSSPSPSLSSSPSPSLSSSPSPSLSSSPSPSSSLAPIPPP